MSETPNLHHLSWDDIEQDAKIICEKIGDIHIKSIIAVARGGLVPAGLISQMLPNRNVDVISMATYDGKQQRENAEFYKMVDGDGKGCVIIDDLSDTGNTFAILRDRLPEATYVTLYTKPKGATMVDITSREFPQDTWLVFPWEYDD